MKKEFYTAIGTPLTAEGKLIAPSLKKHIEQQIDAGASGILLMGSMGIETAVMHSEYAKVVDTAIEAVNGRITLFVGAMDTSIARVLERIEMIGKGKKIDGIVVTAPFFEPASEDEVKYWFNEIANKSPYPIYMYDLPSATGFKISMNVIDAVINNSNIKGMKTADWELIKAFGRKYPDADFACLYSGLDTFDYACTLGITKNLDGMFCCTPKNGKAMYECLNNDDYVGARRYLDNILLLRDTMIENGLWGCFTICMNMIGIEGNFNLDFSKCADEENAKKVMADLMKKIGEI